MSISIAGRCGALVALMAINFSCVLAQEKQPCERAAMDGHVPHKGAIVDDVSGCCVDLADLAKRSQIIIWGEVTYCNGRVAHYKVGI